jgi:hypothetical protein
MEIPPPQVARVRRERYAQWEKAAPITCLALAVAAAVSAYTYRPSPLVVAGTFMGGLASFFSWRSALLERHGSALAHAMVSILLGLSGVVFAGQVSRMVMFAQSFPWLGLGLFLAIWFNRRSHATPPDG